jgi:hypothetical protein
MCATWQANLTPFEVNIRVTFGKEYSFEAAHYAVFSSLVLLTQTVLRTQFSNMLASPHMWYNTTDMI